MITTSRYAIPHNGTLQHSQQSASPHLRIAQHPSSMATHMRSQQWQAEGISRPVFQDLELPGSRDLLTSTHPAPPRRPRFRESSLRVFRCVASIRLNLDFPSPRPHCTNLTFWAWQAPEISSRTGTLPRRYRPIPTHISRPLKLHFPNLRVISRSYGPRYPFRRCADNAATQSSRSRTSPLRPSPTMK